ncbi:aldehyde dehydrogenase family protein [Oceanimonas baumannii]|uniref:Aldehyde dehydrogenase n=1 Tax=Oceanimonas baumannii TaxID=129578 RepID=A0A235CMF2_9GAMM|nr:aldehyde dehydrogenase family protein [Oceanimonas baumannii]OYD25609.1 aldehyde dehydrogenase [Oceanimonas baumannii]TDW61179.1 succinate-semialdehyde dehydrogenase/glutarate-semialdehyde dehydrogenase [Oceanimonas baumannii]
MTFVSFEPSNGRIKAHHACLGADSLERHLVRADEAASEWQQAPFATRTALLFRLASVLSSQRDSLARELSLETGTLLTDCLLEVERCAEECAHFAAHGQAMLPLTYSQIRQLPLGLMLVLTAGPAPMWQCFRLLVPALMAGNSLLLKPAEHLSRFVDLLERLMTEAEVPEGLVTPLRISKEQVAGLVADPRIGGLAYSGERQGGAAMASLAGGHLKPVRLDLARADVQLILDDAELEPAVESVLNSCVRYRASWRQSEGGVLITPGLADAFLERLTARLAELGPGQPNDTWEELGPLAKSGQREWLERQLREAERRGGRIRCGGFLPDEEGWYYPPTLIEGDDPAMTLFPVWPAGPLCGVLRVPDEAAMVALCRSLSPDGIASVWTQDRARGELLARDLPFDLCRVNPDPYHGRHWPPFSDPSHRPALKEFCRTKTVLVSA